MSSFSISAGNRVTRGQKIGEVGNTGRSTAPHLHYEVHVDRKAVDPLDYIFDPNAALYAAR
jgi:murein DD-endopeptidase MepM/ murein hydrolase activator NlpD